MTKEASKAPWLDFEAIKTGADVRVVLEHYGLLERMIVKPMFKPFDGSPSGDVELIGWCPMGTKTHGKGDSFQFNTKKKAFQCFACKARGSLLDFIRTYQAIPLREAAMALDAISRGRGDTPPTPREVPEEDSEPGQVLNGEASEQSIDQKSAEIASVAPGPTRPVDDPTATGTEVIDFDIAPVIPFDKAMAEVASGIRSSESLVAIDKTALFALYRLVTSQK